MRVLSGAAVVVMIGCYTGLGLKLNTGEHQRK